MRVRRLAFGGVIGAAMLGGLVLAPATALAQEKPWPTHRRGDGYSYYRQSEASAPGHGYEGFVMGPGGRSRYCSYRRIPNRVCDSKGCRAGSWTLEQYCY